MLSQGFLFVFIFNIITPVFFFVQKMRGCYLMAHIFRTSGPFFKILYSMNAGRIKLSNRYRISALRHGILVVNDFLLHFSQSSSSFFWFFSPFTFLSKYHLSFAKNPKENDHGNPEILALSFQLSTGMKKTLI